GAVEVPGARGSAGVLRGRVRGAVLAVRRGRRHHVRAARPAVAAQRLPGHPAGARSRARAACRGEPAALAGTGQLRHRLLLRLHHRAGAVGAVRGRRRLPGSAVPPQQGQAGQAGGDGMTVSAPTRALAEYLAAAPTADLPPAVVTKACAHILDTVAAMVSGAQLPAGKRGAAFAAGQYPSGPATVIGAGFTTRPVDAALANGMSAHADETDDSHP